MTDSSLAQAFLRLGSSLSASKNTSGLTQMGNKHRSKRRDSFKGWRCDSCAEMITSVQAGWVEWLASEHKHGNDILRGLRLVHRARQKKSITTAGTTQWRNSAAAGPLWRGCLLKA